MSISDDVFEQYALEQERLAQEAQNRSAGGGPANYEKIMYTGLEVGKMKLIRAVGGPPDAKIDNFTARTCRIAWIVGDDGRKFRVVLPERYEDPEHILWRIIARVKAVEWVDKKKVYPLELKHPQIFNTVVHNGFSPTDKQYIYDRGWEGQQRLIMNVIDREQMSWHRENKHTMLLSRNIAEGKDGTTFPEEGVPVWGFAALLANLFKYYKSWERYDIGIIRTGMKEVPYRIINASKYIEEVPDSLKSFVVQGPLTEEEASWERYDLEKLFGVTPHIKIYNRLKLTIGRIDAVLGTHFLEELEEKVAKEKAELEKKETSKSAQSSQPAVVIGQSSPTTLTEQISGSTTSPQPNTKSTTSGRAPSTRTKASPVFDASLLKGWEKLNADEKAEITGITVKEGKLVDIQYANANEILLACPECGIPSPDNFVHCPSCGLQFS